MTSTPKSSSTPAIGTSQFTNGNGIDFPDFSQAFGEADANINVAETRVSVSANDTHVKNLTDAISVGTGLAKAISNASADEILALTLDAKFVALLALLTAAGKITVSGIDSQSATNGHVLTANGSGGASFAAAGGGGAAPVDITGTAGETLAVRDLVYLHTDNKWYKIDIDVVPIKSGPMRGIVQAAGGIANNATGAIRVLGEVAGFSGLTAWQPVYASTTAGGYTQTKPAVTAGGGQRAVIEIGLAVSTTAILVWNRPVEYHKRESLASGASTTLVHHSDPSGRSRSTRAYISTATTVSLTAYPQANQDSDVDLRRLTTPVYGSDETTGKTASAQSTLGGFPASNVIDNSSSTLWGSNNAIPAWWKVDLGSGVTKTIRRANITGRTANPEQSPTAFTIEASNDDSSWTILSTQTGLSWSSGETKTFDFLNPTAYRYYRINSTASGSSLITLAEVELLEIASYTGTTNDRLAQSFQIGSTQTVEGVYLWLKKTGAPSGTLTLRIETDNAGAPSGTLANASATVTVSESSLSTSYGNIFFDFGTNFSLTGSTTYWLVLSTDRSGSGTNYVAWGADGSSPGYSFGEMLREQVSTWGQENKDACFDIAGVATTFDEPVLLGSWSLNTGTLGVQYGDGSAINGNTNTTFKNNFGATLDVTCVVVLP